MNTRFRTPRTRVLAAAVALALVAAACGSDDDAGGKATTRDTTSADTTSADTTAASPETTQGPTTDTVSDVPGDTTQPTGDVAPLSEPVTIAVESDDTYWQEPMHYAEEQGWFEDVGITITPVSFAGDTAIPLLENGEAEIGVTAMGNVIVAVDAGLDLRAFAGMFVEGDSRDDSLSALVVAPGSDITDVAGLEGATIAVNELRSASVAKAMQRVEDAGGDPSTIKWTAIPFPGMVEAMTRGDVDAAVIVAPFTSMAEAAGATWISPLSYTDDPVPVYVAKASWLEQNPEVAATFLAVLERAYVYANDNREEMKASFVARSGTPGEIADLLPDLTWVARLSTDVVERNIAVMSAFGFTENDLTFAGVGVPEFAR